jgi:hypothetical protein
MLLIVVVLIGACAVPFVGGRFGALAEFRFRRAGLLAIALVIQVLIVSIIPDVGYWIAAPLHLGSYAAAAIFLWSNRRVTGLWILTTGAALNAMVITLNGGIMPASARALAAVGRMPESASFENSTVIAHPRIGFLGDVFRTPAGIPFANVFSIGDLLIGIGALITLYSLSRQPAPRQQPDNTPAPTGQRDRDRGIGELCVSELPRVDRR